MKKISLTDFNKTLYFKDDFFPYSYIDHTRFVVRGIILNSNNEIVMHTVKRNDQFGNAIYLETPGGGVKNSEDYVDSLKREILEEVGVTIKDIKPLMIIDDYYILIHRHNVNLYFLAVIKDYKRKNLQPGGDELIFDTKFYTLDAAIEIMKNLPNLPIINNVNQRELPVLEYAKKLIEDTQESTFNKKI